jgi:phosphoribosylaminoimidazole-succinocarboxamide synthase
MINCKGGCKMVDAEVVLQTNLADVKLFSRGKVRDLYEVDGKLVIVTTDRISAFDSVLPDGIPSKGKVLTALSEYWFRLTEDIIPNHLITTDVDSFPAGLKKYEDILRGRSMLVKKTRRLDVECVVRGYLAGSGWKEYEEKSSICGVKLPAGMVEAQKLGEPIFTPATKADSGHDVNISQEELEKIVGTKTADLLKKKSLEIYLKASGMAESKGVIISDTKMEFGFLGDELILIDELLTPDSSRFWPMADYKPGGPQKSFDKQFVRDYLEEIGWDKTPPAPPLPAEVAKKTSEKYLEAYERIVGKPLE